MTQKEKLMKNLGLTSAEADEVLAYDKAVEQDVLVQDRYADVDPRDRKSVV